jgi:hypothetical protein
MLDYLRLFLQLVFAISVMYMLLDCKEKLKKNRRKIGIYALVVILCDALAFYRLGYTRFLSLYPLFVQLPVFLAFVYLSKFKFIKVFFVHLTVVAITLTITAIGLIVAYYFGYSKVVLNLVSYILYLPVWYLIYKYLRPTFLYTLRSTNKGWIGFCVIPLAYTMLLYTVSTYNLDALEAKPITMNVVFYFALVFASYYMILRYFRLNREQMTLQNEQDLLIAQVSAAQTHLEALKESQEKTVIYRHDMRHHLKLLSGYLADNNREAAQKYISDVGNAIEETVVEQFCENYTVNLILSSHIKKANNEGIKVYTQIELPEKSPVSDMDICVVFSNVIENAINACRDVPNSDDRKLSIMCKNRGDKLFIQVTNSFNGDVKFDHDLPVTTVEDHGLGIKSILAVSQKYGGVYSFAAEDGVFSTCLIL